MRTHSTHCLLLVFGCVLALGGASVVQAQPPGEPPGQPAVIQDLPSQKVNQLPLQQEIRPGWPYLSDFLVGNWAVRFAVGLECQAGQTIRDLRYEIESGQHLDLAAPPSNQVLLWNGEPVTTERQHESRSATLQWAQALSQECSPGRVLQKDLLVLRVEGRCSDATRLLRRRYFLPMELQCQVAGPDIYSPQVEDPGPPELVKETYAEGVLWREVGASDLDPLGDLSRSRDDELGYRLTLGRTLGDRAALQVSVSRLRGEVRAGLPAADGRPIEVSLTEVEQLDVDLSYRHRLAGRPPWGVYLLAGGGYTWADTETVRPPHLTTAAPFDSDLGQEGFTLHGGLALHYDLSRNLYLTLDAQSRYYLDRADEAIETRVGVGVGLRF